MALTIKVLGQNVVGTNAATHDLLTVYAGNAVPNGKAVIVNNIRFVNRDTVKRTVTINYLPAGSNARTVSPSGVAILPGGLLILDEPLMLVANDKLQAVIGESGGNVIDFVVGGFERDQ